MGIHYLVLFFYLRCSSPRLSSNTDQLSPLTAQGARRQKLNLTEPDMVFRSSGVSKEKIYCLQNRLFFPQGSLARAAAGSSRRLDELARRHGCIGTRCPALAVGSRGNRRENWAGNDANTFLPKNKDLSLISRHFTNHQGAQGRAERVQLSKTIFAAQASKPEGTFVFPDEQVRSDSL